MMSNGTQNQGHVAVTFNIGDRVYITSRPKITGTVIKIISPYSCEVDFDDKNLVPPQMEMANNGLTLLVRKPMKLSDQAIIPDSDDFKPYINPETNCPKCGSPWKETMIGITLCYDCLKCNKKKEDICS